MLLLNRSIIILACLATLGFSCSENPKDVDIIKTQKSQALMTQADKRAIFMFESREFAYACPEPSPDVRADIDTAIKSLASLGAKIPEGASADIKAELESSRKLITAALIQRSQGLQVLRDMLFQACLANLRGDMAPEAYTSFVTKTLPKLTTTLIASELLTRQDAGKTALVGKDLENFLSFLQLYQGP